MTDFRAARPADAEAIAAFQAAMARETESLELDLPTVRRGVAAVFADPSKGRYFVADEGAGPVASLLITYEWSDWRDGVVWWIQSVFVTPEARGRKVYSGLYAFVQALAWKDERVRGLRLYVEKKNLAAQKVYAALGMSGEHYTVFERMKTF